MPVGQSPPTNQTEYNECDYIGQPNQAHKQVNTEWSIIPQTGKSVYLLLNEMGATQDREIVTQAMAERLRIRGNLRSEDSVEENQKKEKKWVVMIGELRKYMFVSVSWLTSQKTKLIDWLEIVPQTNVSNHPNFRCSLCYRNRNNPILNQRNMPCIASGFMRNTWPPLRKSIAAHPSSEWHQQLVDSEKTKKTASIMEAMAVANGKALQNLNVLQRSTARTITTVYAEIKMYIPFRSHETLVTFMEMQGLPISIHHRHQKTPPIIANLISSEFHQTLLSYILHRNRPISIIMDTSTDSRGNDFLVMLFQTLEQDKPVVYYYKLVRVKGDVTALGYLNLVRQAIEPNLWDYLKNNLVGLSTDGVSTFTGVNNGFGVLLSKEMFGEHAPRQLFHVACLPHKLQLAARRVVDQLDEQVIKNVANMYNVQNPKNVAHIIQLAEVEDMRAYKITYAFDTRWATSEHLVLAKLRKSLALLLVSLESISMDHTFRGETRSKAAGIHKAMRKRSFILTLFHLSDFISEISSFSQRLQVSAATLIGQEKHRANLFNYVEHSAYTDGTHLKSLFNILECRAGPHSTAFHKCKTAEEVESSLQVPLLYGKSLDKKVSLEDIQWELSSSRSRKFLKLYEKELVL